MSRGPGNAQQAILKATAEAQTPTGIPLWICLAEIDTKIDRQSLSRAAHRLARDGKILLNYAWASWTPNPETVRSSPLRTNLKHGTLIVRATLRNDNRRSGTWRTRTLLVEGSDRFRDLKWLSDDDLRTESLYAARGKLPAEPVIGPAPPGTPPAPRPFTYQELAEHRRTRAEEYV